MGRIPFITFLIVFPAFGLGATNIAPSKPALECGAIVRPTRHDLEPWLAGSAYSPAVRLFLRNADDRAAKAFDESWKRVRQELAASFGTRQCDYDSVNTVLDRRVFKAPPDAVPALEEFGMPQPIALAAASSACRAGDPGRAMSWLAPAADSGEEPALAAYIVLLSRDSPKAALALAITADALPTAVALAGCLASIRAGTRNDAMCSGVDRPTDNRQAAAILDIIASDKGLEHGDKQP